MTLTSLLADTALWTITRDGQFVACGSSPGYPAAWAAAMSNLTRFMAWDDGISADEWDMAEAWGTFVNATVREIGVFTVTTSPLYYAYKGPAYTGPVS